MSRTNGHTRRYDKHGREYERKWVRSAKRKATKALRVGHVEAVPVVRERVWQVGWP